MELDINFVVDGLKIFDDINLHSRKSLEAKLNFQSVPEATVLPPLSLTTPTSSETRRRTDQQHGWWQKRICEDDARDMPVVKLKRTDNVSKPFSAYRCRRRRRVVVPLVVILFLSLAGWLVGCLAVAVVAASALVCLLSVVSWSSEK